MKELKTAIKAVKKASRIVMGYYGKIDYSLKKGTSYSKQLVTKADLEAESALFKALNREFPDYNFHGEEKGLVDKKSEYTWLADPISATHNFVHKTPHFAVVLSLLKKNKPVLAVVLDSFYGELFYAVKGKGAYLGNAKLKVSGISEAKKALVTPAFGKKDVNSVKQGIAYSDTLAKLSTTRRFGSLALQLAWIGAGRLDAFIHNENDFFSLVAGALILEEAGGKVTDFKGKHYSKESKSVVASNGKIHNQILKIVNAKPRNAQ